IWTSHPVAALQRSAAAVKVSSSAASGLKATSHGAGLSSVAEASVRGARVGAVVTSGAGASPAHATRARAARAIQRVMLLAYGTSRGPLSGLGRLLAEAEGQNAYVKLDVCQSDTWAKWPMARRTQ